MKLKSEKITIGQIRERLADGNLTPARLRDALAALKRGETLILTGIYIKYVFRKSGTGYWITYETKQ